VDTNVADYVLGRALSIDDYDLQTIIAFILYIKQFLGY